MADGKKYSRDMFSKALGRIANRIDTQQEHLVSYTDTVFHRREVSKIVVKNLWAVGSWARGALECGDLDLVLEVSPIEGRLPFESNIRREIIGNVRYVRTYVGTPQENSSGADFSEAVLIWSPTSRDWRHNIDSIKPNPNATRFHRKIDALPLRPEQLQGDDLDELEKIVDLKDEGYINWDWIALDSIIPDPEQWSEAAQTINRSILEWRGKKTHRVIPFVLQWFEDCGSIECWKSEYDSAIFHINGAEVIIGRPHLPVHRLEELSCSKLLLVPHITTKGPNGLWVIRRGEKHPVVECSPDLGAYVLFSGGKASTSTYIGSNSWDKIKVLSIYRYRELAQEKLEEERAYFNNEGMNDVKLEVRYCILLDLLDLIGMVDEVEIDNEPFAITSVGCFFEQRNNEREVSLITADELKNILLNA